jgi:hypothetical protein
MVRLPTAPQIPKPPCRRLFLTALTGASPFSLSLSLSLYSISAYHHYAHTKPYHADMRTRNCTMLTCAYETVAWRATAALLGMAVLNNKSLVSLDLSHNRIRDNSFTALQHCRCVLCVCVPLCACLECLFTTCVCVSRVSLYYLCVRVSSVETLVAALSPLPRDTRTSYCSPVATTSGRCGGLRDVVHAQCNGGGAARHGRYWATAGVLQAPTSVCVCMHACVCVCVCVCVCRYWETAGTDKSHIRPWLLALKSKCSGKARGRSLLAPPSPLVALSRCFASRCFVPAACCLLPAACCLL